MEKQEEESVETLNMTKQSAKQINPLKVLIDHDTDVRATNFHGTSKNGRSYVQPQICFVRATGMDNKTGKGKNIDISFPFHNIQTIIDSLTAIRDKNEEYFDDNWRYKTKKYTEVYILSILKVSIIQSRR